MKITYLGHSAFLLEGDKIKALIDPFISGNPKCTVKVEDLKDITHIFLTHGHGDHLGDTVALAKANNSLIVCPYELGLYLAKEGLSVHTMHIGGRFGFDFGTVKMTPALHGGGIEQPDGTVINGGTACGYVIGVDGKKVYHAGDTGLTMDMKLLEYENIDVALLPIGGNFTMDIQDAIRAVDFIKPKTVVPMHYDTFPVIEVEVKEFKSGVKDVQVKVMNSEDMLEI
ncbi:metal-dependent hydrolase [Clostridiaceae bacterium M8S5]|nr:metal-dependent hydrolase [Clostridiaceae bacterium M8S5]